MKPEDVEDLLAVAREAVAAAKKLGPLGAEYCAACEDRREGPAHAPDCAWEAKKRRWDEVLDRFPEEPS